MKEGKLEADALTRLKNARDAFQALIEVNFVAQEAGWGEEEREAYVLEQTQKLKEALGVDREFCILCGDWYQSKPEPHTC